MKSNTIDIRRTILISIMLFCIIMAMITYWIYAYYHKHYNYSIDNKIISHRISDYLEVDGNLVYLKNITDDINNSFLKRQRGILDNNEIVDTNIDKNLDNKILSIKISYIIYGDLANHEKILTLNVDLESSSELGSQEMLDMASSNYKNIATDLFNEYIRLSGNTDKMMIDAITGEEMSSEEFNANGERYIVRIREKLPEIMSFYITDGTLFYTVKLQDLYKLCYQTNMDNATAYIKKEIGKIDKEEL